MTNPQLIKFKRDLIAIYFTLHYVKNYLNKNYATCFGFAAKTECLESHISGIISRLQYNSLKNKYNPEDCGPSDPYRKSVVSRFNNESGKKFLRANILCIKPWISEKEKGVFMIKYTEIMNALPFLFDMEKLQEKYDLVIEPSWESPYEMYSAFLPLKSDIFVQSLSIRERELHAAHGFKPVPLTAGDWVNIESFYPDESIAKKYDFCIISNFIPVKRYPYLLSALSRYWTGDLKFAIAASSHVGHKREWIENLLKKYGLFEKADIFIEVKHTQINEILNASYCHVLASRREGANKANFESMMAGTPVVVLKTHIGFPNWKFTPPLVANYTTPQDLVTAIKSSKTTTRAEVAKAASEMIGYIHASNTLNKEIKKVSLSRGDEWTVDILPKINRVHLFYGNQEDTRKCIKDYQFIESIIYEKSYYQASLAIERFSKNESI